MEPADTTKDIAHFILTGDHSRVNDAIDISQSFSAMKKIVLIVPAKRATDFKTLRTTNRKISDILEVQTDDIAQTALDIYEIIMKEKKIGMTVIINISDSSVQPFTIAACILGSIIRCKVISSSLNKDPLEIPTVPYSLLLTTRYEILKALGKNGVPDVATLIKNLADINPDYKNVSKCNISPNLKRLENRGFITRKDTGKTKNIMRTKLGLLFQKAYEDSTEQKSMKSKKF